MLVVIVILGIIAAIAIPMVMSNQDKVNENAAKQTNAVVKDAAQSYAVVEETYTKGTAVKMANLTASGNEYLKQGPKCPKGYNVADAEADLLTNDFCTISSGTKTE